MSNQMTRSQINRRSFLTQSTSCGAYVLGLTALAPIMTRKVFAFQEDETIVAKEKWGYLKKITDKFYAVISTPFDERDFTTVCNGGFAVGKDRVLAIESFMNADGAKWMAEQAKKITGMWPTDVVSTHFHADHSSGAKGYLSDGNSADLWLTKTTLDLINKTNSANGNDEYPRTKELAADKPTELDLGGTKVTITPRVGHTPSDVTIEVEDPNIVYCGDLFFNRMIPNYSDAQTVKLHNEVDLLLEKKDTIFVPGHGPVASNDDLSVYRDFLGFVQETASGFHKQGLSSEEAAKEFKLAKPFEDWFIFSDQVVPRAMAAWYREFESDN